MDFLCPVITRPTTQNNSRGWGSWGRERLIPTLDPSLPPSSSGLATLFRQAETQTVSQSVGQSICVLTARPPALIPGFRETFELNQRKPAPSQLLRVFFFQYLTGCELVAIHLDRPTSCVFFFFQCRLKFFFIVMTTSQELGHWQVSRFSNVAKLRNAKMKQKLRLFVIHQTATSLKRTGNLNPRTRWYPTQDESNRMESAYFIIHPGKISLPQNGCWLKSFLFTYL